MSDGIRIHDDLTNEVRRVTLEGGRERVHPTGAAAVFAIIAMLSASIGFLAGWIVGAYL